MNKSNPIVVCNNKSNICNISKGGLDKQIKEAAKLIQNGELVAFPTETVYGLGADATNQEACLKIYQAKSRPSFNPLIVHVSCLTEAFKIGNFSNQAKKLAKFWPGPLTLVVKLNKNHNLAPCITADLDSVAIRIPANKIAQNLIELAATPIAAPSANFSGQISSTNFEQVANYFKQNIFILDGGDCRYGIESTIVDLTNNEPMILRHGFITQELVESVVGSLTIKEVFSSSIKAPGMMQKHYSPISNLRINVESIASDEVALNFGSSNLFGQYNLNLSESANLVETARNLYAMLQQLDDYAVKYKLSIAVAKIPNINVGVAINDRLVRAAYQNNKN